MFKNVTLILAVSLLCFHVSPAVSRPTSAISQLLFSVPGDEQVKNIQESIKYLRVSKTNTPFIDEIELRGGVKDLNEMYKNYGVRIKTSGWGETNYEQKIYNSNRLGQQYQQKLLIAQLLRRRYELISEIHYYKKKTAASQKLQDTYSDEIKVLKNKINTINFKISDIIDAETSLNKARLDNLELESEVKNVTDELAVYNSSLKIADIQKENIISIETIKTIIKDIGQLDKHDNLYLKYYQQQYDIERLQYLYEKNRDNKIINFLQLSYEQDNNNHELSIKRNYSIDFGVRVPITRTNQKRINAQKLKAISEKNKYIALKKDLSVQLQNITNELNSLLDKYQLLKEQAEDSTAKRTYQRYSKIKGVDPYILLKINEQKYKDILLLCDVEIEIYKKYFLLLDLKGIIAVYPRENLISEREVEKWQKMIKQ